jgi:hypothetical protein
VKHRDVNDYDMFGKRRMHIADGPCWCDDEDMGDEELVEAIRSRPDDAAHVMPPTLDDAKGIVGPLMHFVGGSPELAGRFARWLEHHEGDMDADIVRWYLTQCHKLLEPECQDPIDFEIPGRTR